eukprot:SAG31_NODE_267_length_18790_cov_3.661655_6_plen_92_part_00
MLGEYLMRACIYGGNSTHVRAVTRSAKNDKDVAQRREILAEWSNHVLNLCSPNVDSGSKPLGGSDCVAGFFAPNANQMQMETVRQLLLSHD